MGKLPEVRIKGDHYSGMIVRQSVGNHGAFIKQDDGESILVSDGQIKKLVDVLLEIRKANRRAS